MLHFTKTFNQAQKMILSLALVMVSLMASAQEARVQKFELKTCNEKMKCLRVKSDKAVSSQFLPLYIISNVEIQVVEKGITKIQKGASGSVDFVANQVILHEASGNEYAFDLKTIEETEYLK